MGAGTESVPQGAYNDPKADRTLERYPSCLGPLRKTATFGGAGEAVGAGIDSGWLHDGYLIFHVNTVCNPLAARASDRKKRANRPAAEMKTYCRCRHLAAFVICRKRNHKVFRFI